MNIPSRFRHLARPAAFCALVMIFNSAPAFAIDAPTNPRGTEVAQSQIKWEWDPVPGAVHYEVTVDGILSTVTSDTSSMSNDTWAGDHSMTVQAVDERSEASSASLTAKITVQQTFDPAGFNQSRLIGVDGRELVLGDTAVDAKVPMPEQSTASDQSLVDPVSWTLPEAHSKPGYELAFSDEFNAATLNPVRWNAQLRWDGDFNGSRYEYRQINGEEQFYVNVLSDDPEHRERIATLYNPFQFDGSRLAIRATRNPLMEQRGTKSHGALMDVARQRPFLSGAISTYDKFTQKYGYFEARIKIPAHIGTFPAFWLHHQQRAWQGTYRSEIDIMENLGHAPWYIYNSFHYFTGVTPTYRGLPHFLKPQPDGQVFTGVDYSLDYHVYAVEWEPGRITWLIDGMVVSELLSEHVNYEELYLVINLAMGGIWTNFPTNAGGLGRPWDERYPSEFDLRAENFNDPALEIDYVRVYRRR